jgi:hypothetical protein
LALTADEQFLAARDAASAGDRARLERLAAALQGYELEAYVEYWQLLLLDLKDSEPATVGAFLARHENTYVAEKLRVDWLRQLGRKQQWAAFDAEYPRLAQPDQDLACYALQSRQAQGDATVLDAALPLWLTLLEPPEPCYPVLEALILEKRVLADAVWARIRRQFEANKISAAIYTMNYLPASQAPDKKLAQTVADTPLPWLSKLPSDFSANRMQRELATLAIQRIARNDPRMAADQLERIAPVAEGRREVLGMESDRLAGGAAAPAGSNGVVPAGRGYRPFGRCGGVEGSRCAAGAGLGQRPLDDRENAARSRRAAGLGLLAGPRLPCRRTARRGQRTLRQNRWTAGLLRQSGE